MTMIEPGSPGESLFGRVKAILTRPRETWDVIDAETSEIGGLYRSYVAPLAAIPAVCGAVGLLSRGSFHVFGFHYRPSVPGVISDMVVGYVLSLVGVYVLALVIDELAPRFDAARSRTQAFKLAAYSGTAWWVAGIFQLIPGGGILTALAGLYGLYIMYLGLPKLMRCEPERTMPYFLISLAVTIVLGLVISMLSTCFDHGAGRVSI
jgi:hypothetical protein